MNESHIDREFEIKLQHIGKLKDSVMIGESSRDNIIVYSSLALMLVSLFLCATSSSLFTKFYYYLFTIDFAAIHLSVLWSHFFSAKAMCNYIETDIFNALNKECKITILTTHDKYLRLINKYAILAFSLSVIVFSCLSILTFS